jgi:pyruvate/2-oxoglutarate dehydrogenase complex dihydrolipoamide dehydrogenase (E3) component
MADARDSQRYGIRRMPRPEMDFGEVMARIRQAIARIEPHDSRERYESMGVDVIEDGHGWSRPGKSTVDDRRISARSIVLATGAEPLRAAHRWARPGRLFDQRHVVEHRSLPERLLVLGGGPIGCELSQAFARLGSQVTIVEQGERLLPREDREAGGLLEEHLIAEGVNVAVGARASRVERTGQGGRMICATESGERVFKFDHLLVALGRKPRVAGYGLEELGVELNDHGSIESDGFQRTRFPNIYVCGDAAGPYQFTHVAAHQAWSAAVNALISPWWSFRNRLPRHPAGDLYRSGNRPRRAQ